MIIPLSKDHSSKVAELHISGIPTGFISSLGINFVTNLYIAISEDPNSFAFVSIEDDEVLGFVTFSNNLGSLYKYVIMKKSFVFLPKIVISILRSHSLFNVLSNLLYPSKMANMNLPDAELLSIVVAKEGLGKGLGRQLIGVGFNECRKQNIDKVKVLVAADNVAANKMYKKSGFQLATQIESHHIKSNIYTINFDLSKGSFINETIK